MSSATSAHGTLLQRGDGEGGTSGATYTTVAEVVDISGPSLSAETIDVTNHSSASNTREYIAGLKDGGEVSFTINYLPANATHSNTDGSYSGLLYDWENRQNADWKVVFTDSGTTEWTFSGFITSFSPTAPIDDKLAADVTIKVSGAPTIA